MKRLDRNIILLAFLALPFGFLSYGPITEGQLFAFIVSVLAVVASRIENVWIRGFLYYACIWQLFILVYRLAVPSLPIQIVQASLERTGYFLTAAVLFVAIIESKIKLDCFYNAICVASIIQCLIGVFQFFGFDPVRNVISLYAPVNGYLAPDTVIGTLINNNFLAGFVAMSCPFFFRKKWAWFLPMVVFTLIAAKTTTAAIAAIMGAIVYFRRWEIGALGGMAALAYGFLYHPFLHNDRFIMWRESVSAVISTPFSTVFGMGHGAGSIRPYPVHSEWVACLYNYGLLGFVLMAGYAITLYRKNRILFSAAIVALVNMAGTHSLHLAPSAFLIIIIAGLIERERIENGKRIHRPG